MSVLVVATIFPIAEHRDAVIAAFEHAIPQVHAEPGCELYALNLAPDRLVMIEKWSDSEALAVHSTGAALRELGAVLQGRLVQAPEVLTLTPSPTGQADLGAV
jgi:quinol monooxygenase YgiN